MSKKIIILIITIIIIAGLIWFFWLKQSYQWGGFPESQILECECFGFEKNDMQGLDGGGNTSCYGITYNCRKYFINLP